VPAAPPQLRVAPVVLVRAAAWPMEALAPFGIAPELEDLAVNATKADAEGWARFVSVYERTLASERSALRRLTVDDRRFRKALAVSNPALTERLGRMSLAGSRTKKIRDLEITLYRYLARAVGRTEPCDLWAGVAMARWGDRSEVRSARSRLCFAPDLRPFQAMLRHLSRTYQGRNRWKANPTLERRGDGRWLFHVRRPDGAVVRRRLGYDRGADSLLRALLSLPPLTLGALVRILRGRVDTAQADLRQALQEMIEGGVLVGGIDLPRRFATPWQALRYAAQSLRSPERETWEQAVLGLRHICRDLEKRYERMDPEELQGSLAAAREMVDGLAASFGCERPRLPRCVLRCDLRLPYRVVLGPADRQAIIAALEEYETVAESWGMGLAGLAARDQVFPPPRSNGSVLTSTQERNGALPRCLSWPELFEHAVDGDLPDVIRRWDQLLRAGGNEVILNAGQAPRPAPRPSERPPLGAFVIAPIGSGRGPAANLVVSGVLDDVAAPYARFAPLFNPEPFHVRPNDPFFRWLRSALGDLRRRHGIEVAELLAPYERNPNVLARPRIAPRAVELWGATRGTTSLAGARLYRDRSSGCFFIRIPFGAQRLAVFWFPAVPVACDDPVSRNILRTSFYNGFLGLPARVLCFDAELAAPALSPRVRLAGRSILRPRRMVIAGESLRPLSRLSAADRFVAWQHLARRHSWPRLVAVRRDGGPALLVPRGSPLAVEAVCRGVGDGTRLLMIEESSGPPGLVDRDGKHHSVELVVPFARSLHAWSSLRRSNAR
jgi:hypothetical protein